jgi:hypothetical protein
MICNLLATAPVLNPSSHPNTMRARIASACEDFRLRDRSASFSLSSGVKLSGLVGRPMAISIAETLADLAIGAATVFAVCGFAAFYSNPRNE